MKLNILKFQGGGTGLGSLFSSVQVAAPSAAPTDNTDDSDKASDAILSESTLNKLRSLEYGLPNELDRFEVELAALELKLNSGRRVSPREIADIRAKAGRLIAQAGHLKNAEQNAEKNGFLDDVAIDYRGVGYIYAITEKGIDKVSFKQYNPEKHQALTYSELIEYRRQSPQLINDAEVIASINKGVGLEKINTFITDILKIVNDSSSKQEAYTSLQAMYGKGAVGQLSTLDYAAIKDIAQMVEHVGLDTIFKTTNISNNTNLQHAFKYIASILPKNMQALLEASYIVNGGSYKDAKKYVGSVIEFATLAKEKNDFEVEYPKEFNTAMGTKAGAKSSDSKTDTRPITNLEKLAAGSANQTKLEMIAPAVTGVKVTFHGSGLPTLYNTKNEMVGPTTVLEAYNSGLRGMSTGKIYFGTKEVDEGMLNDFLYDGLTIIKASIPLDGYGKPSLKLLEKLDLVFAVFTKNPQWTLQQKNDYLKQQDIPGHIDEYGNYVGDGVSTSDFFIISAYTTKKEANRNYGVLEDNDLANVIYKNSSEHSMLMSRLQSTIASVNGNRDKNDPKVDIDTRIFQPDSRNPLVTAPLFIECAPNTAARASEVVGKNPEVQTQYWEDAVIQDQAFGKGNPRRNTTGML